MTDRSLGSVPPAVPTAVGVGALLGPAVFYLPKRVENLAGPATPLAYLLATAVALAVAAGFAVYASSPLGERDGGVYLAVSRTWGSRAAGFLAAWFAVAAYVALLALLAASLGRSVADGLPPSLTTAVGAAAAAKLAALVVLAVVLGVHLVPRFAGRAQILLTGALCALLLGLVVPGFAAVAPANFDPLLPTPPLREHPFGSLWRATLVATFGFVGLEASAALGSAAVDSRDRLPRILLGVVAAVGLLAAASAFVVLGVIPWARLVFSPVPVVDAAASYLGGVAAAAFAVGRPLATATALVALAWLPSRLLAGTDEILRPLSRERRVFGSASVPVLALLLVVGSAGLLVAVDGVVYGLYLAPTALCLLYAGHAVTAAALPVVRPGLYDRCRFRPNPVVLVVCGVVGAGAMVTLAVQTLGLEPAASVGYLRASPALAAVDDSRLLADPTTTVVPALVGWAVAGIVVYVVARDYRLSADQRNPPLDALYKGDESEVVGDERRSGSGPTGGDDDADGDGDGEADATADDSHPT